MAPSSPSSQSCSAILARRVPVSSRSFLRSRRGLFQQAGALPAPVSKHLRAELRSPEEPAGRSRRGGSRLPGAVRVDAAWCQHDRLPALRWDGPQAAGLFPDGRREDDPRSIRGVAWLRGAQLLRLEVRQLFHPRAIRVHAVEVGDLAALERVEWIGGEDDPLPVRGPIRGASKHGWISQPLLVGAIGADGEDGRPRWLAMLMRVSPVG